MMIAQVARASRSSLTSVLRTVRPTQARTFIVPTAARKADLVQEIYLRELRAYKPTPVKAGDADAHVKAWRQPSAPTPPATAALAAELPEYVAQVVEVETGEPADATAGEAAAESDWFEEDPEEEVKH
ncbi:mitochondrial F1F0 ATP synthase subunit Atp14 [Peziza echinospora]|nr:mitochondrial F1F0 ATP synthase subunit Atp14 [Peziza echinospora]